MAESTPVVQDELVAPEVAAAPASEPAPLFSLDILSTIKLAQNRHGLRHGDYERYRQYCTRRLHRIRKSVKFTHGKNRFQKRTLDLEKISDDRYLLLVLVQAERAWSYAMQKKDESTGGGVEANPRAHFHMVKRLSKAAEYARQLADLCNAKADPRTVLEAEAYAAWMNGMSRLERRQWQAALTDLAKSRTIYEQLGKLSDSDSQELWRQRVEELQPSIRYCNYNLSGGRVTSDAEPKGIAADDDLRSKLDSVISETLKKQSENLREISWRGRKVAVKSDRLRSSILNAQAVAYEIEQADTYDKKMAVFDKMFGAYNDALNLIRDELAASASAKAKSTKLEAQEDSLEFLRTYVSYQKLSSTADRNLVMVDALESRFKSRSDGATSEGAEADKKRARPGDLVRLYETLIQNMAELDDVKGGVEDVSESKLIKAKLASFKAIRCYYMALTYSANSKPREAVALFDSASDQVRAALDHHQALGNVAKDIVSKLQQVQGDVKARKSEVQARAFVEAIKAREAELKAAEPKPESTEAAIEGGALLQHLDEFDARFARSGELIAFPPDFEPVKCKPLLFDLAGTEIAFPDIEARKKAKSSSGLMGRLVGGLWSRS
eukprot:TRINITY_DN7247_c0_g1_i1.p1 TRINITY_DN7247_c0_g1~~TRINITY_DN7247_c0_g1_i1.p1  ORF type:complete len:610 (-),score=207.66 TRINITY_DN7247_c0_g1_i1:357-2186(-)